MKIVPKIGVSLKSGSLNWGPLNWGPLNRGPLNQGPLNRGPLNRGSTVIALFLLELKIEMFFEHTFHMIGSIKPEKATNPLIYKVFFWADNFLNVQ